MIAQDGVDLLAESVAEQVFKDAGVRCGYLARIDTVGGRVLFHFRRLAAWSHQEIKIADLERAHSWQGLFESMVTQTLKDTAPFELARKFALKAAQEKAWGSHPPDVAPAIDQQGRRHFRMFCETGFIFGKGQGRDEDDEGTASGTQGRA